MKTLAHVLYLIGVCLAIVFLIRQCDTLNCRDYYRAWDRLQYNIADCREDPDCYLTLADLERVRELAPHVAACELREGKE